MDPKHAEFLALAKDLEKKKEEIKEVSERLQAVMAELGPEKFIQCLNTSAVYKIVKPKGTFTYYKDLDYVRTALPGEKRGDLTKSEAEEAGFVLKKA